jgi:CHAD domain-containing protein
VKRDSIRAFGVRCVSSMLDDVAFQMANTARVRDEPAVHKLRVSIRRLQQALRLFCDFLDEREVKRLRKQLRVVIKAAAEVRNRDIASTLLRKLGAPPALTSGLDADRSARLKDLLRLLRGRAKAQDRWRARLGL